MQLNEGLSSFMELTLWLRSISKTWQHPEPCAEPEAASSSTGAGTRHFEMDKKSWTFQEMSAEEGKPAWH